MKAKLLLAAIAGMLPHAEMLQNFALRSGKGRLKYWSGVSNGKRECARRRKQMAAKADK